MSNDKTVQDREMVTMEDHKIIRGLWNDRDTN